MDTENFINAYYDAVTVYTRNGARQLKSDQIDQLNKLPRDYQHLYRKHNADDSTVIIKRKYGYKNIQNTNECKKEAAELLEQAALVVQAIFNSRERELNVLTSENQDLQEKNKLLSSEVGRLTNGQLELVKELIRLQNENGLMKKKVASFFTSFLQDHCGDIKQFKKEEEDDEDGIGQIAEEFAKKSSLTCSD